MQLAQRSGTRGSSTTKLRKKRAGASTALWASRLGSFARTASANGKRMSDLIGITPHGRNSSSRAKHLSATHMSTSPAAAVRIADVLALGSKIQRILRWALGLMAPSPVMGTLLWAGGCSSTGRPDSSQKQTQMRNSAQLGLNRCKNHAISRITTAS